MAASTEATLLVVSKDEPSDTVKSALRASAERLGHVDGCSFSTIAQLKLYGGLKSAVFALDPWSVVGIDEASIAALRQTADELQLAEGAARNARGGARGDAPQLQADGARAEDARGGAQSGTPQPQAGGTQAEDARGGATLPKAGSDGGDVEHLAPDTPVEVCGYTFVAVPDFAKCLDDLPAKRTAWKRLQAAMHPGNPLDGH